MTHCSFKMFQGAWARLLSEHHENTSGSLYKKPCGLKAVLLMQLFILMLPVHKSCHSPDLARKDVAHQELG